MGQWVTQDELFVGAYSSCLIYPCCTKGARTVVISRPVTVNHWKQITAVEIISPSPWRRRDCSVPWHHMTSNVTVKVSAAKKTIARRSDNKASALVVAFGTAVWRSPAPNLSPSEQCGIDARSPPNERCLSHSELVLGRGWCVDLSFRWPLVMPFYPKTQLRLSLWRLPGYQVSQHLSGASPCLGWLEGLQI